MDFLLAGRSVSPRRSLALALTLLFLALAVFGARVHWIEEAGTAERDDFVGQAEMITEGHLPRDAYRPLLYPLLAAGGSFVLGDAFAAARLLSNLAAVALAGLAWGFGRRLAPDRPMVAWSALALVVVNPNLWIIGQHVTTDMLFAALAAGSLLAALHHLEHPSVVSAATCGALLGCAAFTRGNALFLLPAIALAAFFAHRHKKCHPNVGGANPEDETGRWWWRTVLPLAAAALAGWIPHLVLRGIVFGDPFFDENWKNLAFKLYGYPDWTYLDRVPFSGPFEILRSNPSGVLAAAGREAVRFTGSGLAQLSGTMLHALAAAAGLFLALRHGPSRRAASWTLFAFGTFVAAVCLTFFAWGRLLLAFLPILATWMAFAARQIPHRRWRWLVLGGLVLLLAVKTFVFRLPAFVERHPYAELAALQELEVRLQPGEALAGAMPFAGRSLDVPYLPLPDGIGPLQEPEAYFEWLNQAVDEHSVAFVVIGALELRQRPPSLLAPATRDRSPMPALRLVKAGENLSVWRVERQRRASPPPQLR
ncbi:MAG: glycosyltransferase family 39 protein [Acidobacteriota bacterium]